MEAKNTKYINTLIILIIRKMLKIKPRINKEEKFLIDIIFHKKSFGPKFLKTLDYNLLIKISSSHLIIPTLYSHLKNKNLLKYMPSEFLYYIREIFKLNKARNEILMTEINEVSKIFKKEKIKYTLLKGSSILYSNLLNDPGERMVGDIDILINCEELETVITLLEKNNYFTKYKYKKWKANVYPNFINKNKIFAIDLHIQAYPKKFKKSLDSKKLILNNFSFRKDVSHLCLEDELKYAIYNYQFSDYGFLKASYSYRKLYDVYNLYKKINLSNLKIDRYIMGFFILANCLNINLGDTKNLNYKFKLYRIRFVLKKEFYFYRKFDNIVVSMIIFFDTIFNKLEEFIFNKDYRKHVFEKIKN